MKKFTLIELLIVIAIIGILITLLLPSLNKARRTAYSAVCKSNLRQLAILEMVYHKDRGHFEGREAGWSQNWRVYLGVKISDDVEDYLLCPEAKIASETSAIGNYKTPWSYRHMSSKYFNKGTFFHESSYGKNYYINPKRKDDGSIPDKHFGMLDRVEKTSNTPLFSDCNWRDYKVGDFDAVPADETGSELQSQTKRIYMNRHIRRTTNHVFTDGSARTVIISSLWSLDHHRLYQYRSGLLP